MTPVRERRILTEEKMATMRKKILMALVRKEIIIMAPVMEP
jgi:hypothetical protein